jgi:hypothetical protein
VVSFTPRPLYSRETAPGTYWIGGLEGPKAVLKFVEKKNPLALLVRCIKSKKAFGNTLPALFILYFDCRKKYSENVTFVFQIND